LLPVDLAELRNTAVDTFEFDAVAAESRRILEDAANPRVARLNQEAALLAESLPWMEEKLERFEENRPLRLTVRSEGVTLNIRYYSDLGRPYRVVGDDAATPFDLRELSTREFLILATRLADGDAKGKRIVRVYRSWLDARS
jgi:predicted metal-dependent hydrolase